MDPLPDDPVVMKQLPSIRNVSLGVVGITVRTMCSEGKC